MNNNLDIFILKHFSTYKFGNTPDWLIKSDEQNKITWSGERLFLISGYSE